MSLWAFTEVFMRVPVKDERLHRSGIPKSRPQILRLGVLTCAGSQEMGGERGAIDTGHFVHRGPDCSTVLVWAIVSSPTSSSTNSYAPNKRKQERRKQGAFGKEDKKRHWQRLKVRRKSRCRRKEGSKEHWEKRTRKDTDSDWEWKRKSLCLLPRVSALRLAFSRSRMWALYVHVYMYMKSYKHTKKVGLRPLASSPLVFLQIVSRVNALAMWRGCLQVRRSRGASSLRHHLLSHTLRRQLGAPLPVDGWVYIHTNR